MFLDEAKISVIGGAGGRGCVSWRREKYVPKGGPDGGDGGYGGDVVLVANDDTDTLSNFSSRKRFEAKRGDYGKGKKKAGAGGEDLLLRVPTGTIVYDISPDARVPIIADLLHDGDRVLVARGGRGGYGNAHFATSTRQRPDFAELGEPGEERMLRLELKLIADVGIIGYPSVGKSSLIARVSSARPKIADYPFTTLIPNLGVATVHQRSFTLCDVPGLIEGASEGKGLGDQFLRHIERCGILLHLLDISRALQGTEVDAALLEADYRAIRAELNAYSPALAAKRELILLNKVDLIGNDTASLEQALQTRSLPVFASISAATGFGTADLLSALLPLVLQERTKRQEERESSLGELPVLKPQEQTRSMGAYRIERDEKKRIIVRGARIEQFTQMTNFESEGALRRFRDVLERIGLIKALERERKGFAAPVLIGDIRVDSYLAIE